MNRFIPSFALSIALVAPVALQAGDLSTNPIARGKVDVERCKNHFILSTPDPCATTPSASWAATSDMHEARARHTATLLKDGTVLVAGGQVASAELYDPAAGTWTMTGALSRVRAAHTATLLPSGKVLVLGTESTVGATGLGIDGSAEIYDPATRQWTSVEGMHVPRTLSTATLLDTGKVLVVGGVDAFDDVVTAAELYDPETNTWTFAGNSSGLFWHTATKLGDGRVLIAGGVPDDWLSVPVQSSQIYDPVAGTFVFAGKLGFARAMHAATLLADGSVLVSGGFFKDYTGPGGYCQFETIAFTERYDPSTGGWLPGGLQKVARMAHTSTLLRDQSVLLTGGDLSAGDCPAITWSTIQDAELSSANALTWTQEIATQSPRANHTATLLTNGSVLIAGGRKGPSSVEVLKSAEIYGPVTPH